MRERQTEQERHRVEALQRMADEQKKLGDEHERALENAKQLREEAEATHGSEEKRLGLEQENFERALSREPFKGLKAILDSLTREAFSPIAPAVDQEDLCWVDSAV